MNLVHLLYKSAEMCYRAHVPLSVMTNKVTSLPVSQEPISFSLQMNKEHGSYSPQET